ncbi:MAG: DUF371 domain-containing protein [Jatrophihabitantaceae bacterium]
MTEPVRFTARGHPAIRATHGKTLELTAEAAITARATCVVGVAARLPDQPLAGPIRLTLSAAGESVSCRAIGNSAWWPASGSAVLRRSRQRLPDTLATDVDLVAGELPRQLVRVLGSPEVTLSVLIERLPGPAGGTVVRCRQAGVGLDRLLAEAAAADLVLAEDPAGRAWLGAAGIAVPADLSSGLAEASSCLADGGRVLVVGAGSEAIPSLTAAGSVEVLGLPAESAVTAAALDRSAVLHAAGIRLRGLPVVAAANPSVALVFRCPAEQLASLLADLGRLRQPLVLASLDDPERPVRGELSSIALPERGDVVCRVAGLPVAATEAAIEPLALVRELLAQSVTPRTIALAVAALPGWSRRSAYEFVLKVAAES